MPNDGRQSSVWDSPHSHRHWSPPLYPEFALKRKNLTNTYLVSNFSIEIPEILNNNENHEVDQQRVVSTDY